MFLGGMFWFIYQDLDNLDKPWFMHALGLITIVFAVFWLLIPMIVVRLRISRRIRQNKERYQKWLADGGVAAIRPRPAKKVRLEPVDPDEQAFFHEKGTLYVRGRVPGLDVSLRPVGRPSDVAFPGHRSDGYVCQRTHCYFTNRRSVFAGKGVDINILLTDLKNAEAVEKNGRDGVPPPSAAGDGTPALPECRGFAAASTIVEPGGLVFETTDAMRFAFTFQNPLIAADVLGHLRTSCLG